MWILALIPPPLPLPGKKGGGRRERRYGAACHGPVKVPTVTRILRASRMVRINNRVSYRRVFIRPGPTPGVTQMTETGFMPWLSSLYESYTNKPNTNDASIAVVSTTPSNVAPPPSGVRHTNDNLGKSVQPPRINVQDSGSDSERYEQEMQSDNSSEEEINSQAASQSSLGSPGHPANPEGSQPATVTDILFRHGAGERSTTVAPPVARCLQSFKSTSIPETQVLAQSSVLRDTWSSLDLALYGGERSSDFSVSLPEKSRKNQYFTAVDPPLPGYRHNAYTVALASVTQATEVIDQDLSLLGLDTRPPSVTFPSRAFAETQNLLKSALNVASYVDHSLFSAILEGREAEQLLSDSETNTSSRSALSDQSKVLCAAAKGLSH